MVTSEFSTNFEGRNLVPNSRSSTAKTTGKPTVPTMSMPNTRDNTIFKLLQKPKIPI